MTSTRSLLLALGLLGLGCSAGNPVGPGSPATAANAIESAHVLVAGVAVEGGVMRGDHATTAFRVQLRDRAPESLAGVRQILLAYDVPAGGMHSNRRGELPCYDDGSHGDDVAGDGIYHRNDDDGTIGCGRAGSPGGTYGYTFRCTMVSGANCGVINLSVTRR